MTREEFNRLLISFGWTRYRDEVGDSVVVRRLDDRIVWSVPQLRSENRVNLGLCLSNDPFDLADYTISAATERVVDSSIICQGRITEKRAEFGPEDARRLSDEMLAWAAAQDLEAGLAMLRALPTDCLGAMPVRHMAALAVAGDVETLSRYHDSFVAGDRLDFVPYITIGHIQRALDFARHRRVDPNWLPDSPRLRV